MTGDERLKTAVRPQGTTTTIVRYLILLVGLPCMMLSVMFVAAAVCLAANGYTIKACKGMGCYEEWQRASLKSQEEYIKASKALVHTLHGDSCL